MTHYTAFVITFGALLCIVAVIAAWLFRSANASTVTKAGAALTVVALAVVAPWQVGAMLGFPTNGVPPAQAELLAYLPHDDEGRVDLWLKVGGQPRAYDVALDDKLKKTLREAQARMRDGGRVELRTPKHAHAGVQNEASPAPIYEIADDAFSLPAKGEGK